MTHPDELLAAYEDGALADGERADLERHLATCARCRDELALARAARTALAAVPDAGAPATIGGTAIARAEERTKAGAPPWYRWAGVAAGIAAAIVALALLLPNVGSNGAGDAARPATGEAAASAPGPATPVGAATRIEHQDADYDAMSVTELARSYAGKTYAVALVASGQDGVPAATGSPAFRSAADCLDHAAGGDEGVLIRLVDATFQGTPAYVGVYLTGPGAGQPADAVRVLVVPKGECSRILSSAWAKL
jgi:hypothetical protein